MTAPARSDGACRSAFNNIYGMGASPTSSSATCWILSCDQSTDLSFRGRQTPNQKQWRTAAARRAAAFDASRSACDGRDEILIPGSFLLLATRRLARSVGGCAACRSS
jgi:hypothetical protein